MKTIITYLGSVFVFLLTMVSCVNDDSFFPDETETITSSITIVTIFNDINAKGATVSENELCFRFDYPIVLGYNNDSSIRIDNFQGLLNAISGQSANFNITGLQFPVEILIKGSNNLFTVKDETALLQLYKECELDTFRDDFVSLFRQCFKFDYPVILLNNEKEEQTFNDDETFDSFLRDQGIIYQPDFKFPINILVAPDFKSTTVSTYYEFYEVINKCVGCPDIRFDIKLLSNNSYQFTPDFEIKDGYEVFFKINGELITDVVLNGGVFTREFLPGTYDICIKIITPDCAQGNTVCKELVVENSCPNLQFEFEKEPGTLQYNFTANFIGINEIQYDWKVDNQVVEVGDGGANGDNIFSTYLTPGVHNVCITATPPLCPDGVEFCKEILACPEFFITQEQQGVSNTYIFYADFPGMQDLVYEWKVNDDILEQDGGPGGDNTFTFEFDIAGTYEVCIFSEVTVDCSPSYCKTIVIP